MIDDEGGDNFHKQANQESIRKVGKGLVAWGLSSWDQGLELRYGN